ncbi:MAG: c-type cytochrome [Saprospiraceae bacterium]|nr:c-type cytochrome [Saprospiraceae bacterium]
MKNKEISLFIVVLLLAMVWGACGTAGGEDPGREFMPDMFHSTAYEANIYDYYYYNTWGTQEEYKKYAMPRKPVKGTIPRGYAGLSASADPEKDMTYYEAMPLNGFVPYYYEDTEEERTRAMEEITVNPFPITTEGLVRAKELYDVFCGICHGEKIDGAGYLVRDGAAYPAQPANLLLPEFVEASEGRYYHAIMYGKNVMGGYADKLSYEERWQVIHYIRSLQAKEAGLEYSELRNTFNNSIAGSVATSGKMDMPAHDGETGDHSDQSDASGNEQHH